jgi:hypothetical protein
MARSNSANDATICIIMRPAGVVVSMFSVIDRKPAPARAIRSMMCSTSFQRVGGVAGMGRAGVALYSPSALRDEHPGSLGLRQLDGAGAASSWSSQRRTPVTIISTGPPSWPVTCVGRTLPRSVMVIGIGWSHNK